MKRFVAIGFVILALSFSLSVSAAAERCQTVMLPESNGTGGAITFPVGIHYYHVFYTYPPGATRVGLEFWSHGFDPGAPAGTLYLLVYLNRPDKPGRRLFHASNHGPEAQTGWLVNFPLSIWMHPTEQLAIVSVNNSGAPSGGYLIVTIRECYP